MSGFELPPGMQVFERGWLSANNILFTNGEETTLVDSGYCTHADQTLALVDTGLEGRQLDFLVNTHLHSDHCGGNAALQKRYPQLETLIPPGHASEVARWDTVALTYEPTGQLCPRFKSTGTLQPGALITFGASQWEIHAASGHDPHSVIFFEPSNKILISADALWENGFGVVFPELEGSNAFEDVGLTLDLIERLAPLTVVPGHGPIFNYKAASLTAARRRLDAFVASPTRHARHASKVLLKFKLLELQSVKIDGLRAWASHTSYFSDIRKTFFPDVEQTRWLNELIEELVSAGAARLEKENLTNV